MIGKGTTIRGSITGDEALVVEGRVEGSIQLTKDLHVSEGATVEADVEAQSVTLSGRFKGAVEGRDAVVFERGAQATGSVKTPRFVLADGARFTGRVEMDFEIEGIEPTRSAPRRR